MERAIAAFSPLSDTSEVHGVGIGGNVDPRFLQFFDNTTESGDMGYDSVSWHEGGVYTGTEYSVEGPVGEVDIVETAEDLEAALRGGSSSTDPVEVGADHIYGGAGDDIIFGDVVNASALPWGQDGHPAKPAHLLQMTGLDALRIFLAKGNDPSSVTNADMYEYISANHEFFNVEDDERGRDDLIYGGDGDDLIFGGGGN